MVTVLIGLHSLHVYATVLSLKVMSSWRTGIKFTVAFPGPRAWPGPEDRLVNVETEEWPSDPGLTQLTLLQGGMFCLLLV